MAQGTSETALDPANPAAWAAMPFEELFAIPRAEVERAQQEAVALRFRALRPQLEALDKLATRQGIDDIDSIDEAVPVFFDHRVLKSYPLNLIEKRRFDRLTAWMQRLTTHDLGKVPLDGLGSVDEWLTRLDEHGMIIGHSTGTTGKLSFVPRSEAERASWCNTYFEVVRSMTGVDMRQTQIPTFSFGYRRGHQMMAKMQHLFASESAGGDENRHCLYDYAISSDLLSMMGRFSAAEERGELDQLEIDAGLLEQRKELIEANRNRDDDLERWFTKLADEYRGQRVRVAGTFADLTRLAVKGQAQGRRCEFAPDSILIAGGGMKGYKDAPADWQQRITEFLGIERMHSHYGMSEIMGNAPLCQNGYFHFLPYTVPVILDDDFVALPREGVQTGRMALFDLLAETYWGAFISGDRVTIHWDDDCGCGWPNPRVSNQIVRFSELEGVEDDKITCAGTAQAYSDFMDYVSEV